MSKRRTDARETYGLDGALTAVEKRRATERVHGHHGEESNDHLASIYEDQTDQFETVVPFIRRGLERDERCLYVADDNDPEAIRDALREGGVDVDAAIESGALSIHTPADTYHRTGEFERDAMFAFWEETLAEARDEEGYAGLRAAAEMTWALDDDDTGLDRLVEYESLLNTIYPGEDYVVLCQYNRERFPAGVLSDVIRSHPLVVYDGTICQNFYYHPPKEFLGADYESLDVERTVEGLVSRSRTERALQQRESELRTRLRQQNVVAELGQRALDEHDLDSLLADVSDRVAATLDADYCVVLECRGDDRLLVREGVGWAEDVVGETAVETDRDSLAGYALGSDEPVIVDDLAGDPHFDGSLLLEDHDVTSAISAVVGSVDDPWGVLGVYARGQRDFSEHDAAFVRSVANTLASAIDRAEREHYLRELYEVTSDADRSFEEKLQAIFDLGCERFDMELGVLARIDPENDRFVVERTSCDHEYFEPGLELDLSETYCTAVLDGGPAGIADPCEAGYEDIVVHREFGQQTYLGARISLEGGPDRTFCFLSSEPRGEQFSETERTFHQLMGEWTKQELEQRSYERRLEESNERLGQFAYAASHDLQEPLRMVSSYLQLIDRRYGDELDGDGEEYLAFAVDGARRMREMIEGLLEYSRVETRGDPFEPIDVDAVVEDVLTDLQLQIDETDAEITADSLPRVYGDPAQLRQLFQNLLENAVEYSGDEPPRVHVTAEPAGDEWLVAISDEGIGIDPDQTERIFEVFQRLHTREEHDGTGIGLALCERIVQRHGGEIRVNSEPGEGSTFSVTLPAADDGDE